MAFNMKGLFISCLFFISLSLHPQSLRTFDCGLFSFEYPITFKNSPIQNAPHMVLKLESDEYFFSASYWDKGFSPNVSIWDEEIVENYKTMPSDSFEKIISVEKDFIQTKGGKRRCLKMKSNILRSTQGMTVRIKMLKYSMINDGYLFIFAFSSQGTYTINSSTAYNDNLMKGLKFKNKPNKTNEEPSFTEFLDHMSDVVKTLNAQCPILADECTIFKQVLLSGRTMMIKTQVNEVCFEFIDFEIFKQLMAENMSTALDKGFVQYLDIYGFSVVYQIYNEYDKLKKTVQIRGEDILRYYKKKEKQKEPFFTKQDSWSKENEYRIVSKKDYLKINGALTAIYNEAPKHRMRVYREVAA